MKIFFVVIYLMYLASVEGNKPHFSDEEEEVETRAIKVKTEGGNANGAPCAIPFWYKGRVYHSCTKKDHSRYWCSTTFIYRKDKKWGNCLGLVYTSGGNANGAACHFPFVFDGQLHNTCITTKTRSQPWCGTNYRYWEYGKWGYCLNIGKTSGGNANGADCVFPFKYQGKTYDRCTKINHSKLWCSTTSDYAKDGKWGNCLIYTSGGNANGAACHFPFFYKTGVYNTCITKDHSQPWCATTLKYWRDAKWGNCLSLG